MPAYRADSQGTKCRHLHLAFDAAIRRFIAEEEGTKGKTLAVRECNERAGCRPEKQPLLLIMPVVPGYPFQKELCGILLARRPGRSLDHQLLSLGIDPYR